MVHTTDEIKKDLINAQMKIIPDDYSRSVNVRQAIQALDKIRTLAFKTGFRDKLSDQSPGGIARCISAWFQMNDVPNDCTGTIVQISIEDECMLIEVCPIESTSDYLKKRLEDCKHITIRSLHQFLQWYDENF